MFSGEVAVLRVMCVLTGVVLVLTSKIGVCVSQICVDT